MELLDAHGSAMREFDRLVHRIDAGAWDSPTPCTDWNVRELLAHLVSEQLWVPHLLGGGTIAGAGDRFDGDVLGDHPVRAWERSSARAREAWLADGATGGQVHVSFGRIDTTEYGWQMTLDLAVHGWDLASALGAAQPIEAALARELLDTMGPQVESFAGSGIFGEPVPVAGDAPAADRLVALLGRDPVR
ncbi:TIGR03086 family protein [Amycolatopsis antarctica]|uniref:TIGR03086 family protein n=1 Tax=Amycolatopsis antarctica TaxID=1854586 RepID=A0A263D2G7_9PSEU|nr:TIGR03086 family metal-binding protein [Amycolatopsis antarctica]OZM72399.1 TIGR03086 family protein [Amycolatopsis antarctica]